MDKELYSKFETHLRAAMYCLEDVLWEIDEYYFKTPKAKEAEDIEECVNGVISALNGIVEKYEEN